MQSRTRNSTRKRRATAKKKGNATTNSSTTMTMNLPTLKQSAWMHPTIRAWLISLRPWSFPASLGPVALAGALLHRPLSSKLYIGTMPVKPVESLLCWSYVLCFIVVLSLHASANLFNTYYDYVNGTDTKESADDRGLVDGTVSPATVFWSATSCSIIGLASASYLTLQCPALLYCVVLPAAFLCILYTANPCSLKKYSLGDVTIFLMFGPLLMIGVSVAVAASAANSGADFSIRRDILLYSLPMGCATVGILHANNARDVVADKSAGLNTLAMKLGKRGSYYFHCLLMFFTYGSVLSFIVTPLIEETVQSSVDHVDQGYDVLDILPSALRSLVFGKKSIIHTPVRQLIVLLNLPWCFYVTRLFGYQKMKELPQKVAQHNLLFTTLLVMSLCEPMFLARVLLTCLFYLGGVNNIIMWSYNIHLVHMKLNNVFCNSVPKWTSQILVSQHFLF
jgi:1,4-dihydroxy-2-naphthoate octaprenyltransferase